jgi:hypothetical protein
MLQERDLIVLTTPIPEEGLEVGDVGTVVMVHQGGHGYDVEFVTFTGETVAEVTLPAEAVRPVGQREIAHVREVA